MTVSTKTKYYKFLTSLTANTHGWRVLSAKSLKEAYRYLDSNIPCNDTMWKLEEITPQEYYELTH